MHDASEEQTACADKGVMDNDHLTSAVVTTEKTPYTEAKAMCESLILSCKKLV